jgi:hypothetical protein
MDPLCTFGPIIKALRINILSTKSFSEFNQASHGVLSSMIWCSDLNTFFAPVDMFFTNVYCFTHTGGNTTFDPWTLVPELIQSSSRK